MGSAPPQPFFDQLLTNSGDSDEAGVLRRSDPVVAPSFPCLTRIGLQQDAGHGRLPRRVLATLDQSIQALSLFRTEIHDILLTAISFAATVRLRRYVTEPIDSDTLPIVNDVAD